MRYSGKAEITIHKVDNGYIIEWEVEDKDKYEYQTLSMLDKPPTEGVEICKTKKEMLKFIETKL